MAVLFLMFPQNAQADLIPLGKIDIPTCSKIVNLNDFPKLVLIGETDQFRDFKKTYSPVKNDACITLEGHKSNGFTIYAANVSDLDFAKLDTYNYADSLKFYPLSEAISGSPYLSVNNFSTQTSETIEYKILGVKDKKVDIYRVKTTNTYSDKANEVIPGMKPLDSINATYLDSINGKSQNIVVNPVVRTMEFMDLKGHFALPFVKDLYESGVIDGRSVSLFAPDETMNRAEALKLIMKAFYPKEDFDGTFRSYQAAHTDFTFNYFSDVPMDVWYAKYVQKALASNIINKSKTLFHGGDQITRAEYLKLVMGAAVTSYFEETVGGVLPNIMDLPLPPEAQKSVFEGYFSDVPTDSWYAGVVATAVNEGIIDKAPKFFPERSLTRGEGAKILFLARKMMHQ